MASFWSHLRSREARKVISLGQWEIKCYVSIVHLLTWRQPCGPQPFKVKCKRAGTTAQAPRELWVGCLPGRERGRCLMIN